ncbi:MAG: hypothetical protein AAF661_05035 [Pseudomonadota bacterium]
MVDDNAPKGPKSTPKSDPLDWRRKDGDTKPLEAGVRKPASIKAEPSLGKDACINGVLETAARMGLDDTETAQIKEAMESVEARRRAERDLDDIEDAFMNKAGEIRRNAELGAIIEERNAKINVLRRKEILSLADLTNRLFDDPSVALEAIMVGVNRTFAGSRDSVDARAQAYERKYLGGMLADLKAAGVLEDFRSRVHSDDVARELWALSFRNRVEGLAVTGNDTAYRIAKIINTYERFAVNRQNRAGAFIRLAEGRVVRNTNDVGRIKRAGLGEWSRMIERQLDWDRMDIAPERRAEFLESAFDAVTTGIRRDGQENDIQFAFKGPGNLAKKASASRTFIFKSADDWLEYNKAFGSMDVNDAVMNSLRRSAENTALMERFGTNPRAMFDSIRDELLKKHRADKERPKSLGVRRSKTERLGQDMTFDRLDAQFKELDGTVNIPGSVSAAYVFQTARAVISAAKLGAAVISSITDLANVANTRLTQTGSQYVALRDSLYAPIEGFSRDADKRAFIDVIGVGLDTMLGDVAARFSVGDDLPGLSNKLMSKFFRYNLLGPWTDAVKRAATYMVARDLGRLNTTSWSKLQAPYRDLLTRYGVGEAEWKIARKGAIDINGQMYLSPDEIEIRAEQAKTPKTRKQYERVADAIRALYVDQSDYASPTPGARERAIMRQGTANGTVAGEALRSMMQFKAFPITVMSKGIGQRLYTSESADIMGLVSFMAYSTLLGMVALEGKEVIKRRSPRFTGVEEFGDEQFRSLVLAGMLQGGGAGILGDFLFGDYNRFGGSGIVTAAGPLIGEAERLRQIVVRGMLGPLMTEDGEEALEALDDTGAELSNFLISNTPGANLFYVRPILDALFLHQWQEILNPGYLKRAENRMKREQRQEPLRYVPILGEIKSPSEAIARGGREQWFDGVRD